MFDVLRNEPHNYILTDVGPPTKYLEVKCGKYNLGDSKAWFTSADLYLHQTIKEVETKWWGGVANLPKI